PDVAVRIHLACAHRAAHEVAGRVTRGEGGDVDVFDELLEARDRLGPRRFGCGHVVFDALGLGAGRVVVLVVGHASSLRPRSDAGEGLDRHTDAGGHTGRRSAPGCATVAAATRIACSRASNQSMSRMPWVAICDSTAAKTASPAPMVSTTASGAVRLGCRHRASPMRMLAPASPSVVKTYG